MASAVRAWRSCSRSSAWRSRRETRASARRCSDAGVLGREQGEDQVDRLVVHGLEVHRLLQAHEDAAHALQALEPGVRHGHAVADAGRAGLLALGKRVEDRRRRRGRSCGRRSRRPPPAPDACWPRSRAGRSPLRSRSRRSAYVSERLDLRRRLPSAAAVRRVEAASAVRGRQLHPFAACVRSGSIQPMFPSGRRYTTDKSAVRGVPEHDCLSFGQVQLHHRHGDGHRADRLLGLGDDHRLGEAVPTAVDRPRPSSSSSSSGERRTK